MAARPTQPIHQTPRTEGFPSDGDLLLSTDKVDCERGAFRLHVKPDSSRSRPMHQRLLTLAAFLTSALLVQRFWPVIHRHYHGWRSENAFTLDNLCPQVNAFTQPGYEAMFASIDEEFNTSGFKLKAYESLGGAVRIP